MPKQMAEPCLQKIAPLDRGRAQAELCLGGETGELATDFEIAQLHVHIYGLSRLEYQSGFLQLASESADLDPTFAYATKQPDADLNLGWHCDSGSFYDFGSHDTFLNFYVIVQKSDPQHSNLSFVSWDTLRELDPALPSKLKGGGSVNFNECAGQFLMDDTFGDTALKMAAAAKHAAVLALRGLLRPLAFAAFATDTLVRNALRRGGVRGRVPSPSP